MNGSMTGQELTERELLSRPVAGLQYMLSQLAQGYPELVHIMVDGVFGERTLEAVMRFQKAFGLPVTGVVNRETWDAIRDRWVALEGRTGDTRPTQLFPSEGTSVQEGQEREYMVLPQTMFQILSRQLEGIVPHPADGIHGSASAENVRWLQKAAGLPQTGTLDRSTWDVLSRLYEVFVVRELENKPLFIGGWG